MSVRGTDSSNVNIFATAIEARAQIRESVDSDEVLAEMDCEFDANNEVLTCTLTPAQTANLDLKIMRWDLRVTWPNKVDYLLEGKATLNFSVTRED